MIRAHLLVGLPLVLAFAACGPSTGAPTGPSATSGATTSASAGGASTTASSGTGVGGASSALDDLLKRLRADRDGTLQEESDKGGWPVRVDEGLVVVSTDPALDQVAGDFDNWSPEPLTVDQGFDWAVVPDVAGEHYKLAHGTTFQADPWSRSYGYDSFGEISMTAPATAHLERYFAKGTAVLEPRTVRVWVPTGAATHVLYAADGQNLFDPNAFYGGWKLDQTAPAGMMIVGVDNTAARMDEYTHVPDVISGSMVGGLGDEYAILVETVVRPLVAAHYGEPAKVGLLGSSLGGLISLHVAYVYPGEYDLAASMSGTLGWGSIALQNETIIQRYQAAGHQSTVIYLDSGGDGTCVDSDNDGTMDDDPNATDNYCETVQMRDTLAALGYQYGVDLHHWHEPGAQHNEQAWAARVFRPLQIFAAL